MAGLGTKYSAVLIFIVTSASIVSQTPVEEVAVHI
jgi:hypothetical protein